jgi:hypothetical protein
MKWLDKLEPKFGYLGLEGLMRYISMLMLTVFFLNKSEMLPYHMLYLHRDAILDGQIWRLFTFLLIPASTNFFFLIFELSILVMCADGLEARWGTFRLTAYYFIGAALTIIAALFVPGVQFGSYFIYLSLFMGFATLYPDYEILFMFIIPLKMKFIAMLSAGFMLYRLAFAPWQLKIAVILALGNYLLFFAEEALITIRRNRRQIERHREFAAAATQQSGFRHRCTICGNTELSHPEMQFRYCTCPECGENGRAFCSEHLKQHKEAKNQSA